jgi:hypothetical protein
MRIIGERQHRREAPVRGSTHLPYGDASLLSPRRVPEVITDRLLHNNWYARDALLPVVQPHLAAAVHDRKWH